LETGEKERRKKKRDRHPRKQSSSKILHIKHHYTSCPSHPSTPPPAPFYSQALIPHIYCACPGNGFLPTATGFLSTGAVTVTSGTTRCTSSLALACDVWLGAGLPGSGKFAAMFTTLSLGATPGVSTRSALGGVTALGWPWFCGGPLRGDPFMLVAGDIGRPCWFCCGWGRYCGPGP
jgi:hypothetical protein